MAAATTMAMRMGIAGSRCAVCFDGMGHGQAIFTAECSHTFHLRCVPATAICPVCHARWRDTPAADADASGGGDSLQYDDDEPVELPPPAHAAWLRGGGSRNATMPYGLLALKTHCEFPALSKAAARDGFAVLVHATAPAAAPTTEARAPVDLVTVLDVSGSMAGEKLALVKRAMGFVVDNLGAGDRLSVVAFDTDARRVIRLTRMSADGKAAAKRAVESLVASGCTNIRGGLDEAAKVLDGRRHRNAVASVILLSDGQDNQSLQGHGGFHFHRHRSFAATDVLVPPSFKRAGGGGERCAAAVHAFGFGTDHDAAAMHGISEVTGGTFSFIENHAAVQDAFAQCIGGLLSVAVQRARISVECLHPGVRVRAVKSGRYESCIDDAEGRAAAVDVGELYADEERRFLLFLDVPKAGATDDATRLISVRCAYRDTATGQAVEVAGDDAVILRPLAVAADAAPDMEVERERVRVEAAEDMALARETADRGDYGEAARILDARREALSGSAPAVAGDAMCRALVAELHELSLRVADEREYEQTGRACFLAGMSSHAQQRSSSVRLSRSMAGADFTEFSAAFATPAMRKMEKLSEKSRERQQNQQQAPTSSPPPPPPLTEAVPRSRLEERLAAAAPRINLLRRYRRLLPLRR